MIYRLLRVLQKGCRAVVRWHYRNRPPPWVDIPGVDPLGVEPGEHNTYFVSRHHIAESGLLCPGCGSTAAYRAEFKKVCTTELGEAVNCTCGAWLVASPDTEHGDDRLPYTRKMHVFVRISQQKALREQYGDDISSVRGRMAADYARFKLGSDAVDALTKKE